MSKTEKIYPKGLFINAPREGAPDFVLGSLAITKDFITFLKDNQQYFNDKGYLRLNMLNGNENKPYVTVDTWGLDNVKSAEPEPLDAQTGDLPF